MDFEPESPSDELFIPDDEVSVQKQNYSTSEDEEKESDQYVAHRLQQSTSPNDSVLPTLTDTWSTTGNPVLPSSDGDSAVISGRISEDYPQRPKRQRRQREMGFMVNTVLFA